MVKKVIRKSHWRRRPDGSKTWVKTHKVTVHSTYKVPIQRTVRKPLRIDREEKEREIEATITKPTYALQDPVTGKMLGSVSEKNIHGKVKKSEY